jgi:3-deoxy-7-phosphoheptulonate synthase
MTTPTEDLRIRAVRPLLSPAIVQEEIPATEHARRVVSEARAAVEASLHGEDSRLVVVVGPCSIHDLDAAREYAQHLEVLATRYQDRLITIMRCYFEKPRTTVGWKGLINDPGMDGSYHVNEGLRRARRLLAEVAEIGLPSATEFLDTTVPQHIADLIAWGAIGARTSESQTHRELASGLSMPVGFKNATDGNVQVAIDALKAARQPHWFPGATKDGISALIQSAGNPSCHIILRGGARTGPNYGEEHVRNASTILEREGLPHRIMIDLSHGNSSKDHLRQITVAEDVARQIGSDGPIFGVMIESNLVEGRQELTPGRTLTYGQSVTDACISLAQTETVLDRLARAR